MPPAALDQGEAQAGYAPARAERRLANTQAGEAKYQQALALRERGLGNKEIGQRLGVGARTIGRWMSQQRGPATGRRRKKPSQLDRFVPYLLHSFSRWVPQWDGLASRIGVSWVSRRGTNGLQVRGLAYEPLPLLLPVRRQRRRGLHPWMA